jgi:hypothetical protein
VRKLYIDDINLFKPSSSNSAQLLSISSVIGLLKDFDSINVYSEEFVIPRVNSQELNSDSHLVVRRKNKRFHHRSSGTEDIVTSEDLDRVTELCVRRVVGLDDCPSFIVGKGIP